MPDFDQRVFVAERVGRDGEDQLVLLVLLGEWHQMLPGSLGQVIDPLDCFDGRPSVFVLLMED